MRGMPFRNGKARRICGRSGRARSAEKRWRSCSRSLSINSRSPTARFRSRTPINGLLAPSPAAKLATKGRFESGHGRVVSLLGPAGFTLDPANLTHDLFYVALVLFRLRTNQRRSVAKGGRLRPPLNGCVTG